MVEFSENKYKISQDDSQGSNARQTNGINVLFRSDIYDSGQRDVLVWCLESLPRLIIRRLAFLCRWSDRCNRGRVFSLHMFQGRSTVEVDMGSFIGVAALETIERV